MPLPADDAPNREPTPLEHRTPEPTADLPPLGESWKVLLGVILAVGVWGSVGLSHIDRLQGQLNTVSLHLSPLPIAIWFFVMAAISVGVLIAIKKDRRHLLIGLLIGTAIMGLVEGLCFLNQ